jgi:HK97 family phage major capsid protein
MTTATAIPQTGEELQEALHDAPRMNAIFNEGNMGAFMGAYVEKFVKKHEDDVTQFAEKAQADIADFMRIQAERNGVRPPEGWEPGAALAAAKGRGPRRARAVARSKMGQARGGAMTAEQVAEFFDRQGLFAEGTAGADTSIDNDDYTRDLKTLVWATIKGEHVAKRDGDSELHERLMSLKGNLAKALQVKNASQMSERIPSEGGLLVPENLRSEMLALSLEEEVVRPEATIIPMDSLRVPLPSIDDTSHQSNVFGGVSAAWTAEGATLSGSAPKFARLNLIASKLTAWTLIPNELLQDSITPMDVWFRTFFPQAMAFFADLAFLVGDGVDQPEGILECPGAVTTDPAASGKIALSDVIAMLVGVQPGCVRSAPADGPHRRRHGDRAPVDARRLSGARAAGQLAGGRHHVQDAGHSRPGH